MTAAIEVDEVSKRFGATVALDAVSFTVDVGTVLALLGPNGAGKTTLVRVLTTLLVPDSGHARVGGFDVQKDARTIRSMIGLAGQYATVDELLTGRRTSNSWGSSTTSTRSSTGREHKKPSSECHSPVPAISRSRPTPVG